MSHQQDFNGRPNCVLPIVCAVGFTVIAALHLRKHTFVFAIAYLIVAIMWGRLALVAVRNLIHSRAATKPSDKSNSDFPPRDPHL